jgi:hypothetical protein
MPVRLAASLLLLSCSILPSLAQETAEITGRITDSTGAVISAAAVEITSANTNATWTVTTSTTGYYTQPLLPPGDYRITVRVPGFKQEVRHATLEVQQVARLDFTLQVGAASETIEVTAAAPLLESGNAAIGQVIDTQAVTDMPLNGRNYLDLAKLSIGVVEPADGDRAAAGGAFVANGVRSDMNNFILDGVDNNAKIVDLSSNTNVVVQPSIDALMEFKVETNTYSAEYGHSAGAVVSATLRSGTNKIHGTVFEFIRNDKVDARSYFLPVSDRTPELRRNQYGATLGGPIRKNKTFLFGSWQGTRQNSAAGTIVETLAGAALRSGNFAGQKTINDPAATVPNGSGGYTKSAFPGNLIPANRVSGTASGLLAPLPLPEFATAANNYASSPLTILNRDGWDLRGDQNFSNADKLFLRYSYYTLHYVNPGPLPAPLIGSTSFQQSINDQSGHNVALGETHVFGAAVVNEFRAGYNRVSNALHPFVTQDLLQQFGFGYIPPAPGLTGLPTVSITGYSNLGEAGFLPDIKGSDTLQLSDGLAWNKGSHFIKVGGEYRWVRSRYHIWGNARGSFTFNGAFTGNAFADFLLGDTSSATISSVFIGDIRYVFGGAYVNDDWKITPRFTLNLGLRYELTTPPFERNDLQSNFIVGPNKLIYPYNKFPSTTPTSLVMNLPDGVDARGLVEPHYRNFAPRAGLAYQWSRNTVIRAGGGVFFGDAGAKGASGRPTANPPFRVNNTYSTDSIHPNITFASGFPANAVDPTVVDPSATTFIAFDPAMAVPVVYHWSFSLQQQISRYLLDTSYVGTKGTHLEAQYNINQDYPGAGSTASRRPYQGFADITYSDSMGNSSYHALQVRLQRRYSNGVSLLASYTYSRTIDLGNGQLIGDLAVRNVLNVGWERAEATTSIPHRFVVSYTYALPVGSRQRLRIGNKVLAAVVGDWQLNGITTIRDGHPFTPVWNVSSANTGTARPDRIRDGNLPADQRTVNRWFDIGAFVYGVPYNYGNSGRDVVYGPGAINFDFSTFKRYALHPLGDSGEMQLRFEGFNVFNHPQFGTPNVNVTVPAAGTITTLSTNMRQLQAGLKILF